MTHKAYIGDDGTATFTCPQCNKSKTADVSRYKDIGRSVKVKFRCPCGFTGSMLLERRKYFRKPVSFKGVYSVIGNGGAKKDLMMVLDLSVSGIKCRVGKKPLNGVSVGAKLLVEFNLDDRRETLVRKGAEIRSIRGGDMGLQFCSIPGLHHNANDRAIGFYMMA